MKNEYSKTSSLILIMLLFVHVVPSHADTIILKNGQEIVVEMAWEEGDFIKGSKPEGIVGFPKDSVENVIYEMYDQNDSFQFDMWNAGITIEKAFRIAESYDLPINKVGIVTSATNFKSFKNTGRP